ncbi:hypothetical protein vseg_016309 [Gypsophila vaccaria]
MGSKSINEEEKKIKKMEKSYFEVLGLCCSSEVPLIEKILKPLDGVVEVSVIVPSRTVIVVHDSSLISQQQILKALNQARLEANVRVKGSANYKAKWPSPYVMLSGVLLALSFLKYVYHPFQWLAVAAVAVGILPILMRGAVALRNFTLDVNILMLIAVICTIAMRDYTEAGTIVFLFTIAEWLESRASQKATAVMSSLLSMAPQKATIAETGEVVNVEDVKLNTIVAVKSGEMIPVDGIVVDGTCEVDEKTLTGESYPVPKQKESTVWAGTVNVNGYIEVKTTALAEDSAVAKMARLVEEAQNSRSNVQRLIDQCAKYYTPAVVLISLGVAVIPAILKVHNLKHWFYLALVVLVSACPCGLILSTPVATFCALSRAATSGLLIKGGDHLETLAKIKTIGFDKTGTITRGEFTLMNFRALADDISLSTLIYWVSSIESKSSHPIASVLVDYGRSKSIEPKSENVEQFQNFPGEGVFGKMDGRNLYIGNKKLAERANCNAVSNVGGDKDGATSGYVYSEGVLIGTFSLSDNCRSGAIDAIRQLKAMGIKTALLTGDNHSAAMHAQEQLGNSLDFVHSELLPENKASIITDYKKHGATAMVGDGVNDAPALATADVGISMGVSGSALATETGHVILMSNDIRKILIAIKLARKTRRKVIENIFISIFTKACVLTSAIVWHPLVWLAVLADVMTCLIVIFNSMLLLRGVHDGHHHGRKWFGLFSCRSHKRCHSNGHQHTEVKQHCHSDRCASQELSPQGCHAVKEKHSEVNQKCCSKNSFPKGCESMKCTSPKLSPPCQTRSKCHTVKKEQCCPPKAASVTHKSAASCSESSRCLLQNCASSCDISRGHFLECQPNSEACEGNSCALSESPKKDGHAYHQSSCCHEDQCLESLESQISCDAGDQKCPSSLDSEIQLAQKTCCESADRNIPEHHSNASPHQKANKPSGCKDQCAESLEIHAEHEHSEHHRPCHTKAAESHACSSLRSREVHNHLGHHGACHTKAVATCSSPSNREVHEHEHEHEHEHVGHHGPCHKKAVTSHGCSNLRSREMHSCCQSFRKECCSSQGSFVSGFGGGLTEIVTE